MSGVFSAGVLKAFEEPQIFDRVHSVYAVSVGGCNAARFLTKNSELGGWGFYNVFNGEGFIHKRLVRYYFQAVRRWVLGRGRIDDLFDFDFFAEVMLHSDIKIDMEEVLASGIPFFVKVFCVSQGMPAYVPVVEPHAFEKVLASASATPLISRRFVIAGEEFFDGDTIPSDLDVRLAKQHPDKLVVRISNTRESALKELNAFNFFVVYTLLLYSYGVRLANRYAREFFKRPFWHRELRRQRNVFTVSSDLFISIFSKDAELLKRGYEHGVSKGKEAAQIIVSLSAADL